MNRVAVVVLNWNGAEMLESCLGSLLHQTHPDYRIIVVDNNSTDRSREVLSFWEKQHSGKVSVIYNERNRGFAGGVNTGIRQAITDGYDAVALLNNDAIARPNWLAKLSEVLEAKDTVGIATGLLLHNDGQTIDSTGECYSAWGLAFPRNRDDLVTQAPESGYVFGATGGASMYRVALFRQLGLFDEAFFAYYEDVDLSFRAQLSGWKVYYTREAVALHKRGATSERIPGFTKYQMFKNLPQLFWKNVPRGLVLKIGIRFVGIYLLMIVNAVAHQNGWPALRGLIAGIGYGVVAILKRTGVQKLKKVSLQYVDSIVYQDLPPSQKGRLRKFIGRGTIRTSATADEEPVEPTERQ